jgi:hypothetical protein
MNKHDKYAKLNRMYSLCLHACKRHRGNYEALLHVKRAMQFIRTAMDSLSKGLLAVYQIALEMAGQRIRLANFAVVMA